MDFEDGWLNNNDKNNDPFNRQPGETRTIAVFRAVVFARCGAAVKVPAELIPQ
ncbi:hypothetical protein ACP3PM_20990 [Pseudomonas iridis]